MKPADEGILDELGVAETDSVPRGVETLPAAHVGMIPLRGHDESPAQLREVDLKTVSH